jgi:hypothetical protein
MSTRRLLLLFIPAAAALMVALLWQAPDDLSVSGVVPVRPVPADERTMAMPALPDAGLRGPDPLQPLTPLGGEIPGAERDAGAAAARELGRIHGLLLDLNGKPVPGEPVLLVLEHDPWQRSPGRPGDGERPRTLLGSTKADEAGRFELPARAGVRHILLAGGLAWARTSVPSVQAGEDLRIVLAEGLALEGVVLDAASGSPIAGAWVLALAPSDPQVTRSDENGAFRIGPLPDVNMVVGGWAPGFDVKLQTDVAPSQGALRLELPAGRTVKGRVFDRVTQQPVTTGGTLTLTVDIMARMAGGETIATLPAVAHTLTAPIDANGAFSFPAGPSMGFDLRTVAAGYVPDAWDRAESRPLGPDDDVAIGLWPLGTVAGRVLVQGSSAGGAAVRARGPAGTFFETQAGADGRFTLTLEGWDGARPVYLESSDSTGTLAARARLGRVDEEQVLELVPALSLQVQVVRAGVPVPGAEVAVLSQRSETTLARSGQDGLVTLQHVLAGPDVEQVRVQARHGDSQSLAVELDLSEPLGPPPLVLDLDGGAFLQGVVTDLYGTPIPSAELSFRPAGEDDARDRGPGGNRGGGGGGGGNYRERDNRTPGDFGAEEDDGGPAARWTTARTEASGSFRLGPLPPGEVGTLVARAHDFRDRSLPDLLAGTTDIEVRLDPVVRWEGRVVDLATGQPLDEWYAVLRREEVEDGDPVFRNTRENVERKPGARGEFSVSLPERGRYQLRVSSSSTIAALSFPADFNGLTPPPYAVIGLSPAAVLEVTLLDGRGRPVAGYGIAAIPWEKAEGASLPAGAVRKDAREARTDGAGHARFQLGEGGSYRIAGGPGQWLDGSRVDVRPGAPVQRTFTLPPTGDLEVTLTDDQGKPLPGVRVEVRSARSEKAHSVSRQTGAQTPDGKVLIEGLPPGDYDVYCRRRGFDTQKLSVLVKGNLLERLQVALLPKLP